MKPGLLVAAGVLPGRASEWGVAVEQAFSCYSITTSLRQAAFLAQASHESGGFSRLEENLNYGSAGLLLTFPKHFNQAQAETYAHHQDMIANRAYADRMGNGPEGSGDGWRYRGRGILQLTGKDAYRDCGKAIGMDLLSKPELLAQPLGASHSAGWEWSSRDLNKLADAGDFDGISDLINLGHKTAKVGDAIGYADRKEIYLKLKIFLGIA